MDNFEVDLDGESIAVGDEWRTRDELAGEIKAKLEAGDYQIAQLSQAIEQLNQSLSQMQTLSVRISGDMSEALEAAAQEIGRSPSSIVRQLLDDWLFPKDEEGAESEDAEEVGEEGEEEEADVLDEPAEPPEDEPASDPTPTSAEGEEA